MENLSGLFDSAGAGISTSSPSLLLLNDDCLIEIFKCLELLDFVNLAKTCVRLVNLADDTFVPKFTVLSINGPGMDSHKVHVTKQQLSDIVSLIGRRVVTAAIFKGNDFILETVQNNCKNLNQLELLSKWSVNSIPQLQEIKNVKHLVIRGCKLSNNPLRRIFINNPGIESLKYDDHWKNFDFKLFKFLPKLETLHLFIKGDCKLTVDNATNFFYLKELRRFHFTSYNNCNAFLAELATKSKLEKLSFYCDVNEETFNLLKLFENLTYLKVFACSQGVMPENTDLPTGLKCLSLPCIKLPYRTLASLVKRHKSLEEIYLCNRCVADESGNNSDDNDDKDEKISGIAAAVHHVLQQRTLTIYCQRVFCSTSTCFDCFEFKHKPETLETKCIYDSQGLNIVEATCKDEDLPFERALEGTNLQLIE